MIHSPDAAPAAEALALPEGLVSSRSVGWIDTDRLPWVTDPEHDDRIGLSELQFNHGGVVYIASAGTPALNKISREVSEQDTPNAAGHRKLNTLFLRAASLKAGGADSESSYLITQLNDASVEFTGFSLQAMHESNRPNTRRVYFASTRVGNVRPSLLDSSIAIDPTRPLLVRVGVTDKHHQIKMLSLLTGKGRQQLRKGGAGSI